ncbi:hypothetical protein, partial [Plasmodium yoelii yoelii]
MYNSVCLITRLNSK